MAGRYPTPSRRNEPAMPVGMKTTRVGVIGHGAIGEVVARSVLDGDVLGAELSAICVRQPADVDGLPTATFDELLGCSDLIVEAAGQEALAAYGQSVLVHGLDLVTVSVGALTDPVLFNQLTTAGPGRLRLCTGAIGGVDMVRAITGLGPVTRAHITTIKKPAGLVQPTMSENEAEEVRSLTEATVLYEGDIRQLVARFPASTNVAATLALAVGSWEVVSGTVTADPAMTVSTHIIEVEAASGTYRFEMHHEPSANNPRSSAMVPWAVVRSLRDLCSPGWGFV